jgi:class 3 adenylate cyclase/tetratricopeptide (TPR) repeat protein
VGDIADLADCRCNDIDVDIPGDGGLTTKGLVCGTCGALSGPTAKFCAECGSRMARTSQAAEYKQVTVLFADVVHSMDIAAAVGAERLREIMAELADRCSAVVQRLSGTVGSFTGDGIMAVFGAPVALEDHAVRACLAGLAIQEEVKQLAAEVHDRDGVELLLRVGLNSGQVIAGEIGSGPFGYTTIGEQVGMAQRMESVAPPGGVMLSASTARLVDDAAVLGELESARIKGADAPVPARRLLGIRQDRVRSAESILVGRRAEMSALEESLDRAVDGRGAVVGVVGSAGIGKSRLVREAAAMAGRRGVEVFATFCESHTSQVAFHAVARLLRRTTGVQGLDGPAARDVLRDRVSGADPEDLLLLEDLLGIADPTAALPKIDPDARRRRLTALLNATSLARKMPAVYVIEDVHWIDEASESMLADLLTVIPRTRVVVLITYRPEYRGTLSRVEGARSIALAPLSDTETTELVSELLGPGLSGGRLGKSITERAAGNPFFAEEIVRDLAERDVLRGERGAYSSTAEVTEVSVPATLQATIAARIDRLSFGAKRTLGAAAVIGSRFGRDLLTGLGVDPMLDELARTELIDQVRLTPEPEYRFRHPLIRTVAYESQLKSDRADLHRRLASAIEAQGFPDQNSALIAEHLEAAGELLDAYSWHMRAGAWSSRRDLAAALRHWERARRIADALPAENPNRPEMRIVARTLLCGNAWHVHTDVGENYEELRQLCTSADDKSSLAIGMCGLAMEHLSAGRVREASGHISELIALVESIGDASLTAGVSFIVNLIKFEAGEWSEVLRWSQKVIDVTNGDASLGNFITGSPLALALASRGLARCALGASGWREDFDEAVTTPRTGDPLSQASVIDLKYSWPITCGALLADDTALRETSEALRIAEGSGDDMALAVALEAVGFVLVHHDSLADRERGAAVLTQVRDRCLNNRFSLSELPLVEVYIAREMARRGDRDGAIALMRAATDTLVRAGQLLSFGIPASCVLVETLLDRGEEDDVAVAGAAVDRLAYAPGEDTEARNITVLRLRALLARALGDDVVYRELTRRYRTMAASSGFEGHIAWADAMQ